MTSFAIVATVSLSQIQAKNQNHSTVRYTISIISTLANAPLQVTVYTQRLVYVYTYAFLHVQIAVS